MKKLFLLLIAIGLIFMGCVTTDNSQMEETTKPVEVVQTIDPDSPEGFKAERPWLLPDVIVTDNPEYNPDDVFSSKYILQDDIDINISLNPEYVGEWVVYGKVKNVSFSYDEIDGQVLFDFFMQNGDINSEGKEEFMNWRGIRFFETGVVETNSGNQVMDYTQSEFWGSIWSDGWIISEAEQTRAHSIIYEGDETLLFFELKNGDYFRGRAPTYMVFRKL